MDVELPGSGRTAPTINQARQIWQLFLATQIRGLVICGDIPQLLHLVVNEVKENSYEKEAGLHLCGTAIVFRVGIPGELSFAVSGAEAGIDQRLPQRSWTKQRTMSGRSTEVSGDLPRRIIARRELNLATRSTKLITICFVLFVRLYCYSLFRNRRRKNRTMMAHSARNASGAAATDLVSDGVGGSAD